MKVGVLCARGLKRETCSLRGGIPIGIDHRPLSVVATCSPGQTSAPDRRGYLGLKVRASAPAQVEVQRFAP
jgi:hypothetical protein